MELQTIHVRTVYVLLLIALSPSSSSQPCDVRGIQTEGQGGKVKWHQSLKGTEAMLNGSRRKLNIGSVMLRSQKS